MPLGFNKTIASMDDEEWQKSIDIFRKTDHYDKFGIWFTQNH